MHRVTKLKATSIDAAEAGKASPLKAAKRAADGKPKTVIPDLEDGDGDEDVEVCFFPISICYLLLVLWRAGWQVG